MKSIKQGNENNNYFLLNLNNSITELIKKCIDFSVGIYKS